MGISLKISVLTWRIDWSVAVDDDGGGRGVYRGIKIERFSYTPCRKKYKQSQHFIMNVRCTASKIKNWCKVFFYNTIQ